RAVADGVVGLGEGLRPQARGPHQDERRQGSRCAHGRLLRMQKNVARGGTLNFRNLDRAAMMGGEEDPMRTFCIPLALLAGVVVAGPAMADAEGHVNFFLGEKAMNSDDWDPVDKQGEFGAVMSFGGSDWPVLIAADVLTSGQEEDVTTGPLGA